MISPLLISKAGRILPAVLFLLQIISVPLAAASDFTTAPAASAQTPGMTLAQATNLQAQQPVVPNTAAQNSSLGTPLANTQSMLATSPLTPVTDINTPMEISTTKGHTFYVSNAGSNKSDGTEAHPWSSVQYAVSKLQAGDTLLIQEGTYSETVAFAASGRSDAYITVEGVGNVVFDGTGKNTNNPAFDTKGNDYLKFKNISVTNMRAVVEVSPGSDFIDIDHITSDKNRFAVRMNGSTNVSVHNAVVRDSNNGFRAFGGSRNLTFENIEVSGSKDVYDGMDPNYLNGDGFIFEADVSNVTLRNIVSHDNWDGGIDCKASNVLIENVVSYGNKNNFKMWGQNITIVNSLSYDAKRQVRPDGTNVEGNGLTVEIGGSVLVENVTIADNEDHDIAVYANATLRIRNSIVASINMPGSQLLSDAGVLISDNVLWFGAEVKKKPSFLSSTDYWGNPQFVDPASFNYRLKSGSPAIDKAASKGSTAKTYDLDHTERVFGNAMDLGAYEFHGVKPASVPAPVPQAPPVVQPLPEPLPSATSILIGLIDGQTVSGKIFVEPNPALIPELTRVTYLLNGKKSTKTKDFPFLWGGSDGFDTKKLKDGTYVLQGICETAKGPQTFSITFQVSNKH